MVPELDASDEDSSDDTCSDHDGEVAESDNELEGDVTLVVGETDNAGEVQDLEYGGE